MIGDSRLCTMGCETRSPLYLIGDAASVRGLCTGKVFHPPNGPLNGHPPSALLWRCRVRCKTG